MSIGKKLNPYLVGEEIVRKAIPEPSPDSHKGQNGKVLLVVGGSPLFHGAGRLTAMAAMEAITAFAAHTNDMVYFCSTKENIDYLKARQETFIGIGREQLSSYLKTADVVIAGPGLMREQEVNAPETANEPLVTKELTKLIIASGKKAVLDAGSIQVIDTEDIRGKKHVIITPHRHELATLFKVKADNYTTSHESSFAEIKKVAEQLYKIAKEYEIAILLKGPVDIIADQKRWFFSPGGTAGMTKGGTGDVLAGVVGAIYSRIEDPLAAASAASFIVKRAGERLGEKKLWFYDATRLAQEINEAMLEIIVGVLKTK